MVGSMTTLPKVGQRIRATFEGLVTDTHDSCADIQIGDDGYRRCIDLHRGVVEVLAEPLEINDEIRWGVDPEPPADSILRSTSGVVATRNSLKAWYIAGQARPYFWDNIEARNMSWTVVWLP